MPTRKRCSDNDERDFQALVTLFSAHVFLFAYKEDGWVDQPEFGSFLCETHSSFSLSLHLIYFSLAVIQMLYYEAINFRLQRQQKAKAPWCYECTNIQEDDSFLSYHKSYWVHWEFKNVKEIQKVV